MEIRLDGATVETAIGSHVHATQCSTGVNRSSDVFMEWDSLSPVVRDQLTELQGTLEVHAMRLNQFILSLTPDVHPQAA